MSNDDKMTELRHWTIIRAIHERNMEEKLGWWEYVSSVLVFDES